MDQSLTASPAAVADPAARAAAAGHRWSRRGVLLAGTLLTTGSLAVHVHLWASAGGLWRDEVNSVVVANAGSLRQVWQTLPYDSFPVLWHVVLRLWTTLGTTDPAYRGLGLLAGFTTLVGLWWNARRFGGVAPIVGLLLLGYTASVPVYGDSVRGYGLGTGLALLAMGSIWDLSRGVTAGRVVVALLFSLAAVHVLFYNSALLLAFCCGGCAAALSGGGRRGPAAATAVLAVGVTCGLSMLVYVPVLRRAAGVAGVARMPWSWGLMGRGLVDALRFGQGLDLGSTHWAWVWGVAVAGGIVVGLTALARADGIGKRAGRPGGIGSESCRPAVLFCLVSLAVGVLADGLFLRLLSYTMQPWYFLAGLTLVAGCVDPLYAIGVSNRGRRWVAAVAIGLAALALPPLWADAAVRKTSIDLIAADLQPMARPGDVVVCIPAYYGVTLRRYYHGPASLVGVPPIRLDYQRTDDVLPFIHDPRSLEPLEAQLAAALHGGHRLWLVTDRLVIGPDAPPPPSADPAGYSTGAHYTLAWTRTIDTFLVRHAADLKAYGLPAGDGGVGPISIYERPTLYEAHGWRTVPLELRGAKGRP